MEIPPHHTEIAISITARLETGVSSWRSLSPAGAGWSRPRPSLRVYIPNRVEACICTFDSWKSLLAGQLPSCGGLVLWALPGLGPFWRLAEPSHRSPARPLYSRQPTEAD